jgi:chemotaxis response regulator CheB
VVDATEVRVALLGRDPGVLDQLKRALADAGARLVAEGDPAQLDPASVADAAPGVVVVSLEPAIEDALERFDDLFARPGVEVVFDDAEVTRGLGGWDLNRWARHLAAKLTGSDGVLPPAPAGAELDLMPSPGLPETPEAQMAGATLEQYTGDTAAAADAVPAAEEFPVAAAPAEAVAAPVDAEPAHDPIAVDAGDIADALQRTDAVAETVPRGAQPRAEAPAADDALALDPLEVDLASIDVSSLDLLELDDPAPAAAVEVLAADDAGLDDLALLDDGAELELAALDLGEEPAAAPLDDGLLAAFEANLAAADGFRADDAHEPAVSADDVAHFDFDPDRPVNFASLGGSGEEPAHDFSADADLQRLAASLEAGAAADLPLAAAPRSFDTGAFALADEDAGPLAAPAPAAPRREFDLDAFTLDDLEPAADAAEAEGGEGEAAPRPAPVQAPRPPAPEIDTSRLALAGDEDEAYRAPSVAAVIAAAAPARPSLDGLSLVPTDDELRARPLRGAILLVAGLGGPDAVRQFLAALPPSLPLPVLVAQHLDAGRHDKLALQLAKASRLPVALARDGEPATPGEVFVLAQDMGVVVVEMEDGSQHIGFQRGTGAVADLVRAIADDGAVVLLSGAGVDTVAPALAGAARGGLALAQDPGACFDAAAAQALQAGGAPAADAAALAALAVAHWPQAAQNDDEDNA